MSAVISPCGQYRYHLTRSADPFGIMGGPAAFVMLNPSTADADFDDATIKRLCGFARVWGNGGIEVCNVYALRSTDPAALKGHADPVGPDNADWLRRMGKAHYQVICAWGTNASPGDVDRAVELLQQGGARLMCLGVNKDGSPKHPLYLAGNTTPRKWSPR